MIEFIGDLKLCEFSAHLFFDTLFGKQRFNVLCFRKLALFDCCLTICLWNSAAIWFNFGTMNLARVKHINIFPHIGWLRKLALLNSFVAFAYTLKSSHFDVYFYFINWQKNSTLFLLIGKNAIWFLILSKTSI